MSVPDSVDTYAWRLAPAHLKTRRQLRAAGLRPGGQEPVARMVGRRYGRELVAYLYDATKAVPKRAATPAQLAAIAKAIREHQARAAERRGFSRTAMATPTDPAPAWEHPEKKEGITMSDNTIDTPITDLFEVHQRADQLQAALTDAHHQAADTPDDQTAEQVVRAQERLDAHLRTYRSELANDPHWDTFYAAIDAADGTQPTPATVPATGHGQRMAYLYATVATNQARAQDAQIADAVAAAEAAGPEAVADMLATTEAAQARAEARLEARRQDNPAATVEALADALVWHTNSEIAAKHLRQISGGYAAQWGVRVDAENFRVDIDPDFDAVDAQNRVEWWQQHAREAAVVDAVSAIALPPTAKGAVLDAVSRGRDSRELADPGAQLLVTRREQLGVDLAAVKQLSTEDRARIGFVVDYLRGDTTSVDLLTSPAVVDPGEEARGRVPRLLEAFAHNPNAAAFVSAEIAVMTAADQEHIRRIGREIARGGEVDLAEVFPGYVDRYDLAEAITTYAAEVNDLCATADYLAAGQVEEPERLGTDINGLADTVHDQIPRVAALREQLRTQILDGKGLAAMERAHLTAVLSDIDTGRIESHQHLPELLFADERSKADADVHRISRPANELSRATKDTLTERITAHGVDMSHRGDRGVRFAVDSVGDSLYSVACGARADGVARERERYAERRAYLDQALGKAGIDETERTEIRRLVDDRAREAGTLGKAAAQRGQQWQTKITELVAARDDVIAQRQAADVGRVPGRGCTQRPDRAAAAQTQTQAVVTTRAAGRRQLHSPEVGR
ncbi:MULTISPECIES: RRQRL motif-containing zinc-binding protein [unclassified Nocardia]|uniref:RRQRL motif-containing zinc-binding protein n=1 Tax=unclassified Nocardia TaxID=2637762 RepID=UPI00278BD5D0|nr:MULTISPECIES: RRQRL motif-containing zinc-binding protein [unclassified Nocardia]